MCSDYLNKTLYKLDIKYQVLISIIGIITVNLCLITAMISINVFMLTNSSYKDVLNLLDNQDFDQMSVFSLAVETSVIHIDEFTRDCVSAVTNFKQEIRNLAEVDLLNNNLIDLHYPDSVMHFDDVPSWSNWKGNRVIYFSPSKSKTTLLSDTSFLKELNAIKTIFPMLDLYLNSNVYNLDLRVSTDDPAESPFVGNIILANYDLNVIFFALPQNFVLFPNSKINLTSLKDYLAIKVGEYFSTERMKTQLVTPLTNSLYNTSTIEGISNSLYDLALYSSNNLYKHFYNANLSYKPDLTASSEVYETISFKNIFNNRSILSSLNNSLSSTYTSNNTVSFPISSENYFPSESVIFLSQLSWSDYLDFLALQVQGTVVLLTDSTFPYKLYTQFQCHSLNHASGLWEKSTIYTNLGDCFNKTLTVETTSDMTFLNSYKKDFFIKMGLFNIETVSVMNSVQVNSNAVNYVISLLDAERMTAFDSSDYRSMSRRITLGTTTYKVLSAMVPFASYNRFNYPYPATNFLNSFIIINEGALNNNKRNILAKSIGDFIMAFVGNISVSYIIIFFVIRNLRGTMKFIQEPISLINAAINSVSDKSVLNDKKVELENYTYNKTDEFVINEFSDLIRIILDMLEGNLDVKSELTGEDYYRVKMEQEEFNREFMQIKQNNLAVNESKINKLIEKHHYFNDIINIDLDQATRMDKVVSRCEIFEGIYSYHKRKTKQNSLSFNLLRDYTDRGLHFYFEKIPFRTSHIENKNSIISSNNKRKSIIEYDSDEENSIDGSKTVEKFYTIRDETILKHLRITNSYLYGKWIEFTEKEKL